MINLNKKETKMKKVYRVNDGDGFAYVLANGASDREEKIQNKDWLTENRIYDVSVGDNVVFTEGYAMVNRDGFDLDGFEGVVVKKTDNEIYVKLSTYYKVLDEWDNCIIFDRDSYRDEDIRCVVKGTSDKNDGLDYDKVRFTNKKYFYVNWDEQISKVIDNPYEFFAENNGFSKDHITMIQEMYVGQRKHVDDMMFDIEISRVK